MGMAAHGKMRNLRIRHDLRSRGGGLPPAAGLYRAARPDTDESVKKGEPEVVHWIAANAGVYVMRGGFLWTRA